MSGIQNVPIRWPERYDPAFLDRLFREVLSKADVRNAIAGAGITITGTPDEVATLAASPEVDELLSAGVLTALPATSLARQLVAANSSIVIEDNGAGETLSLSVGLIEPASIEAYQGDLYVLGSSPDYDVTVPIYAGSNDTLLSRVGDELVFGSLTSGMFPNGVVPDAALSANVPLLDAANVFETGQTITRTDSGLSNVLTGNGWSLLVLQDSASTSGARRTRLMHDADGFVAQSENNGGSAVSTWLWAQYDGSSAITTLQLAAPILDFNGAADLSSTLAVAGAITQTVTGTGATNAFIGNGWSLLSLWDSAAGSDEKRWRLQSDNGVFSIIGETDAGSGDGVALRILRTGAAIDEIELNATLLDFNASLDISGTLAWGGGSSIASSNDVVQTGRTLTAGDGLTGGGSLAADRTFNVGAGTGISVSADAVALSSGALASLALADSSIQPADNVSALTNDAGYVGSLSGSFTGTVTGMISATTGTVHYEIVGDVCTLFVRSSGGIIGTSNSNELTLTGLPAACRPAGYVSTVCGTLGSNSANDRVGRGDIDPAGSVVTFYVADASARWSATGFAAVNLKGLARGWSMTYALS